MTEQEAAVIEAAMEWSQAKQASQYGPAYKLLTNALNTLDAACIELAGENEGTWRNPHE